ncbi:hypothetical protein M231_04610 [Tremella mesenterica]|uniref:Uncharacterized protein n=1 Tax=Tremella mesenterica TaxID=5217 RepID=A0A4Q1BKA3_TREME|nr:hypothetical protein M231_04610 [Tremella mesenterica]
MSGFWTNWPSAKPKLDDTSHPSQSPAKRGDSSNNVTDGDRTPTAEYRFPHWTNSSFHTNQHTLAQRVPPVFNHTGSSVPSVSSCTTSHDTPQPGNYSKPPYPYSYSSTQYHSNPPPMNMINSQGQTHLPQPPHTPPSQIRSAFLTNSNQGLGQSNNSPMGPPTPVSQAGSPIKGVSPVQPGRKGWGPYYTPGAPGQRYRYRPV